MSEINKTENVAYICVCVTTSCRFTGLSSVIYLRVAYVNDYNFVQQCHHHYSFIHSKSVRVDFKVPKEVILKISNLTESNQLKLFVELKQYSLGQLKAMI